jgi:hypothetical protein
LLLDRGRKSRRTADFALLLLASGPICPFLLRMSCKQLSLCRLDSTVEVCPLHLLTL